VLFCGGRKESKKENLLKKGEEKNGRRWEKCDRKMKSKDKGKIALKTKKVE
jgi:hypothetical protein